MTLFQPSWQNLHRICAKSSQNWHHQNNLWSHMKLHKQNLDNIITEIMWWSHSKQMTTTLQVPTSFENLWSTSKLQIKINQQPSQLKSIHIHLLQPLLNNIHPFHFFKKKKRKEKSFFPPRLLKLAGCCMICYYQHQTHQFWHHRRQHKLAGFCMSTLHEI